MSHHSAPQLEPCWQQCHNLRYKLKKIM